ncbi:MAG: OmpH family outer membrane protein [Prevotella sp.]|nr:OmpH family outer membrane protein [Prevotella sp.]
MKRLATLFVALCAILSLAAQDDAPQLRFGYLSYEQALRAMPQYAVVEQQIATLKEQYKAELKRVEDEFNLKYEDFLEGQRDFPKTILQKRQTELQELLQRNIAFKEKSREELAQAEEQALEPLHQQLHNVIAAIAAERHYALVVNTDSRACPYIDPVMGEDISFFVNQRLTMPADGQLIPDSEKTVIIP